MRRFLSAFIVFYVLWIALSGVAVEELIVGAVVALLLSFVVGHLTDYHFDGRTPLSTIKYIFMYIPLFIVKLIQANLDMAKIVLSKDLPIKPGFVILKTSLKKDISKLSLANSITLTPGTLSVDIKDEEVLIHWVKVEGSEDQQKEAIAGAFEKQLGGIFE